MSALVQFTRVPLTTPCPLRVTASGAAFDGRGEPLPMEQRPELCAVDAEWLIGEQRVCSFHLRDLFDRGMFDGSYDDLCRAVFNVYGDDAVQAALERSLVPWEDRHRYSQDEARSWAESAEAHGLG